MIHSAFRHFLPALQAGLLIGGCSTQLAQGQIPKYDHVVLVIMENRAYGQVLGSSSAPYITEIAQNSDAALFTQSFALTHPSQPNYLQLFSGSAQGVKDDKLPAGLPFKAANLGAELIAKGFGFKAYSEDLPSVGFTGASSAKYVRKHAPWVNWQGTGTNGIPASAHVPFSDFPADYSSLPTFAYVVPNLINDIHDGTVSQGDAWIKKNLDGYIQWSKTHNSLFIFTFDEDDTSANNRILTFFVGQHVKKGSYNERITHYTILRTIEDMYSLGHAGAAITEKPLTDVWDTASTSLSPISRNGVFRPEASSHSAPTPRSTKTQPPKVANAPQSAPLVNPSFNPDAASTGNFLCLSFRFLVPFQRVAVGSAA